MDKHVGLISDELSLQSVIPEPDSEGTAQIDIDQIHSFAHHPFRVQDDEAMEALTESIEKNGIMTPVIVREKNKGNYELISGHRRVFAAKKLGLHKVPAVIKELDDDEATIAMVDSNLQRELLPSEKAYAFKMKLDAMKHQGTSRRNVEKFKVSADELGEAAGISGRQIHRYIRLTRLNKKLLAMVDEKRIGIMIAEQIADLNNEAQESLVDYIEAGGALMASTVAQLLAAQEKGEDIYSVFDEKKEVKKSERRLVLKSNVISRFFNDGTSNEEIRKTIIALLSEWSEGKRNPGG